MHPFLFEDSLWIEQPRERVFEFFSDASNLQRITPEWLHFQIITPSPLKIGEGTLIDYRLRVHGFPIRWRTRIVSWDPPYRFVDEQLKGPYRLWHHTHTFEEKNSGTLMHDRVQYMPIGGWLINRLFVKRDVASIFAYRTTRLAGCFAD